MVALKLYMTLLAGRTNANAVVAMRHDTLRGKTGCQPNQIRSAISLLANVGLIHVVEEALKDSWGNDRAQKYQIIGQLGSRRDWSEAPVVA